MRHAKEGDLDIGHAGIDLELPFNGEELGIDMDTEFFSAPLMEIAGPARIYLI
jgi:hypothetical protein